MQIKDNIKVSIMCTIMPIAIGYMLYRHHHYRSAVIVLAVMLSIAFLSLIIPKFGNFIHSLGKKIGSFIGKYIAIIILFIGYLVAVIPTGLLMKLVRRDRLRLKKPDTTPYWIDDGNTSKDYELQF
jgi:amino acid permease